MIDIHIKEQLNELYVFVKLIYVPTENKQDKLGTNVTLPM